MIKVECSTTDYAVLKAVSELFAKLAELGVTPEQIAEATDAPVCACASAVKATTDPPTIEHEVILAKVEDVASEGTELPPIEAAFSESAAPPPPNSDPSVTVSKEIDISHTVPPAGVEVDGSKPIGLPWDDRINVATKTKRKSDDTWKLRKNLDPAYVAEVKAELRAAMTAKGPATESAAADSVPPEATEAFQTAAADSSAAPPPPSVETAEKPKVTETAKAALGVPSTFPGLLQAFTFKQGQGKVTAEEMDAICQGHEVPSLALMASRPDLIPVIFADMEALCLTRS